MNDRIKVYIGSWDKIEQILNSKNTIVYYTNRGNGYGKVEYRTKFYNPRIAYGEVLEK